MLYNDGEVDVPIETTYSNLRGNLSEYLDRIVDDNEIVVVRRRNGKNVALIAEHELTSMLETAHLLSSPVNADRLVNALRDVRSGRGKRMSIDELRKEFDLGQP
jgi:antitoxin YefM